MVINFLFWCPVVVLWLPVFLRPMLLGKTLYLNLRIHGVFLVTRPYIDFYRKVAAFILYVFENFVYSPNFFLYVGWL